MLGKRFSTNRDLLGVIQPTKMNMEEVSRAPTVTSGIRFRENNDVVYTIEDSGLPTMFAGISSIVSNADLMRKMMTLISMGYIQDLIIIEITWLSSCHLVRTSFSIYENLDVSYDRFYSISISRN
jgi:hypothetical protein